MSNSPFRADSLSAMIFVLIFVGMGGLTFAQNTENGGPAPLRTTTRAVFVDVVATDQHGRPVEDLKQSEFQVFERSGSEAADDLLFGWTVKKKEQKIAHFEYVTTRVLSPFDPSLLPQDSAVLAAPVKVPSILLVDALNTEPAYQSSARLQMLKAIKGLPPYTPVAVLLMTGTGELRVLQDFSDDHTLLDRAIDRVTGVSSMAEADPRDDTMSGSNIAGDVAANMVSSTKEEKRMQAAQLALASMLRRQEKEEYAQSIDLRVQATLAAFRVIADRMAAYKGRKSLVWVSGSFPWAIAPDMTTIALGSEFVGLRDYSQQVSRTATALTTARIAVYPVRVQGVDVNHANEASNNQRIKTKATPGFGGQLERDDERRFQSTATMLDLAKETGGLPCTSTNDLAGCLLNAVDDGSSYYELGYYPANSKWDAEYRHIIVRCLRKGVTLRYRQGYYAGDVPRPGKPAARP